MQTTYSTTMAGQIAGQPSDCRANTIIHRLNDSAAAVPFGIGVQRDGAGKFTEAFDGSSPFLGVTVHSHWTENQDLSGTDGIDLAAMANIMTKGSIVVYSEEAVNDGDRAYCRVTATTSPLDQLGNFRKTSDAGRAVVFPGRFEGTTAAAGNVTLVFDCETVFGDGDNITNDEVVKVIQCIQATTNLIWYKFIPDAARTFIITGVEVYNPTGLAASTSNSHKLTVDNAAVGIAAQWDTETGVQGTITAATCMAMTNGSLANRTVAAGAVVTVQTTLTGSKTLPAGFITIRGYLVK